MRFKLGLKTVTLPLACLCMAVPFGTAVFLVNRQSDRAENRLILQYARETLARAEQTGDQLKLVADAIGALPPAERCAEKGLEVMRRLDLDSTLLQAVGYAEGETLLCSSYMGNAPVPLGRPDLVSATGTITWTGIRLYEKAPKFLAFSFKGAVGIVHRDLALSFIGNRQGLALATFNWSRRVPLIIRGRYDPKWVSGDLPPESVFRDGGQLVAVVRSKRFDIGSIAAMPLAQTSELEEQAALILLPIGLVTGIVFAVLMVHLVRNRFSLPSLIQQGLRRQEFSLLFQPGVELRTGRTIAAEVLMRWSRPDGEVIPPDVFIAAAEDAGMIRMLTARVFELLSHAARDFEALPEDFRFAVNLAADDLHTPATVEALHRLMTQSGPGMRHLIVEATERSLVDAGQARSVIEKIRALGVQVAIDDFGTGYCSLSYLATLQVDFIKIDKLFVKALGTNAPASSVAGHIIDLARDLNLRIVAEGIETEEQAEALRGLGVHAGQGWLFGPAMTAQDLVARVLAENAPVQPADEAVLTEMERLDERPGGWT